MSSTDYELAMIRELRAERDELRRKLYGENSFNPGAASWADIWEMRAKELESILRDYPADTSPIAEDGSTIAWMAAFRRFEERRRAALTPPVEGDGSNHMLKVGGACFRCDCGCNVFLKLGDLRFKCNACAATFTGER